MSGPAGVKLVEDALDPILAGDRIVVDEPELGRALESQPRCRFAGAGTSPPGRARVRSIRAAFVVAEHRIQDPATCRSGLTWTRVSVTNPIPGS